MTKNTPTNGNNATLVGVTMDYSTGSTRVGPTLHGDAPVLGLNLPFTGNIWKICRTEEFDSAIQAITRPPTVEIGAHFPHLPGGGEVRELGSLFYAWTDGDVEDGGPGPDWPELRGLESFEQIQPLLPTYDFPGAEGGVWGARENLRSLLRYIVTSGIDPASLRPMVAPPFPRREFLPALLPQGEGDVTPDDVARFAANFAKAESALMAAVRWTGWRLAAPAGAANAVASELLGIEVDVRKGFLVPQDRIDETIDHVCDLAQRSDPERDAVVERVKRMLPRIGSAVAGFSPGYLLGAAWSCELDRVLNTAAVWRPARASEARKA